MPAHKGKMPAKGLPRKMPMHKMAMRDSEMDAMMGAKKPARKKVAARKGK